VAIARRIERAENGNLGDVKPVGAGVSEMRIDMGAGYRVYFTMREKIMVILLAGGTKSSQQTDIKKAIELAKEF
jgi:putative addiction module killer protein